MTGHHIAPIPTRHNGVLYRSRTEARWAVFFDVLNAPATYEPESYSLDGAWYLPDFFILQWNLFVEVKPEDPTPFERERCARLSAVTNRPVLMVCGSPLERKGHLFIDGVEQLGNACFVQCRRCEMLAIARGEEIAIALTAPRGEDRCGSGFEWGGHIVSGAEAAAANERFGVFPAIGAK